MKISKQLLKEIITEEYSLVLWEQLVREGMVSDTIGTAVKAFGASVNGMNTKDDYTAHGAKESRLLAQEANRILLRIVSTLAKGEFLDHRDAFRNIIDHYRNKGPHPPYAAYIIEALGHMMQWAEKFEETGKEDYKTANYFNMALNMAAKNPNRRGHGQLPLHRPVGDADSTQAIAMEEKKKPSDGLTKKQKSAVVKKAKAGKDIGKKGKDFDKVAREAGGGEKGRKIAAAAMWKNIKR